MLIGIEGSHDFNNLRQARFNAGTAVANGLPYPAAIKAVTVNMARIFDLPQTGALEVGKAADVVVWSGDPLETTTYPTAVFIDGAQPMTSRGLELRDRYAQHPLTDGYPAPITEKSPCESDGGSSRNLWVASGPALIRWTTWGSFPPTRRGRCWRRSCHRRPQIRGSETRMTSRRAGRRTCAIDLCPSIAGRVSERVDHWAEQHQLRGDEARLCPRPAESSRRVATRPAGCGGGLAQLRRGCLRRPAADLTGAQINPPAAWMIATEGIGLAWGCRFSPA